MNKQRGYYALEIGGKKRMLHFSMNFWVNFTDSLDVKLDDIGGLFDNGVQLSTIRTLIYSAILANDQEKGNEIDYTEFTVGAWLDDLDANELENIIDAMLQSRILGNDLNNGIERREDNTEEAK